MKYETKFLLFGGHPYSFHINRDGVPVGFQPCRLDMGWKATRFGSHGESLGVNADLPPTVTIVAQDGSEWRPTVLNHTYEWHTGDPMESYRLTSILVADSDGRQEWITILPWRSDRYPRWQYDTTVTGTTVLYQRSPNWVKSAQKAEADRKAEQAAFEARQLELCRQAHEWILRHKSRNFWRAVRRNPGLSYAASSERKRIFALLVWAWRGHIFDAKGGPHVTSQHYADYAENWLQTSGPWIRVPCLT